MLLIFETHPVQYHAPVFREAARGGLPLRVCYGSDFSVRGYRDLEFGATFAWDTDLLSGYEYEFLSRQPENYADVVPAGLAEVIRRAKPRAILALGHAHRFDRAAIRASLRAGLPLLLRGEANDEAVDRPPFKSVTRSWHLRRLYRRAAAFLFIGKRAKEHYLRHGAAGEKLIFSPYCVDAASFRPTERDRSELRQATRKEWGIPGEALVLLYSGKLSPRKGVDLLVDAAGRLVERGKRDLHLLFLGDGAMRSELEGALAAIPGLGATFAGFQNQRVLSRFYHAADLLVLPSRHSETWGLVVNEALLHGLPALVSDRVGCQPDLVEPGETGEVFRSGDADSLASALDRLFQSSLVGEEAARTRCRARVEAYSVAAAARGLAEAYRKLGE